MPDQNHDHGMPASGSNRPRRARQIPAAILLATAAAGSVALWSWKERDQTPAEWRSHSAALAKASTNVDMLPFTRGMSVAACYRSGGMAAGCIESETSLRQPTLEAWRSATAADRRECMDAADRAPEPVGALYACLRAKERVAHQPEDPRRPDPEPGRRGGAHAFP